MVGLHGAVYNLTTFLDAHPGSPETLLAHAGADATVYFEHIGHSLTARDLSNSMRVVGPIQNVEIRKPEMPQAVVMKTRAGNYVSGGTLCSVKRFLDEGIAGKLREVEMWLESVGEEQICGDAHVFYDAVVGQFGIWYCSWAELFDKPIYVMGSLA